MGSERFEVESEAWYRAVAEGRLVPATDGGGREWPVRSPATHMAGTEPGRDAVRGAQREKETDVRLRSISVGGSCV
jgi:hypothetical protein